MTDLAAACRRTLDAVGVFADSEQEALRQRFVDWLTEQPAAWSRACGPAHLTASALVCDPVRRRVLLIRHRKIGRWLQTGGHIESEDASLEAAALREAGEETGLSDLGLLPGPTLLSAHRVPCPTADWHYDVQFTIRADSRITPPGSEESTALGWFDPDDLPEPTDASVRDLIQASLAKLTA